MCRWRIRVYSQAWSRLPWRGSAKTRWLRSWQVWLHYFYSSSFYSLDEKSVRPIPAFSLSLSHCFLSMLDQRLDLCGGADMDRTGDPGTDADLDRASIQQGDVCVENAF